METAAVISPRTTSYTPKRVKVENKPLTRAEKRRLGDEYFISQIDEGLRGEYISEEEFLKFLRQ